MARKGHSIEIKGHSSGHSPGIFGATWGILRAFGLGLGISGGILFYSGLAGGGYFLQNFPSLINFKNDMRVGYLICSF
jgi:hypothetical protein